MSLTAKELQQIRGIGAVLALRLLESGHDSFRKIVELGEGGLAGIKGINPRAIPSILAQAAGLAESDGGDREKKITALKESLQGLRRSVQELTATAKERFSEKLAGKPGRKVTDAIMRIIAALEDLENKAGKKLKRSVRLVKKAELQLEGLAAVGLKDLRKGLKRAGKALQRVHA